MCGTESTVNNWGAEFDAKLPEYVVFEIGEDGSKSFNCPKGMIWLIDNDYFPSQEVRDNAYKSIIYGKGRIEAMVSTAWKDFVSKDLLIILATFIRRYNDNLLICCWGWTRLGELLISFDFGKLLCHDTPENLRSAIPDLMTTVTSNPIIDKLTLCSQFMYRWADEGIIPKEITELILRELFLSYTR